ncbi:hypothetical protein [Vibrio vulnificus]
MTEANKLREFGLSIAPE